MEKTGIERRRALRHRVGRRRWLAARKIRLLHRARDDDSSATAGGERREQVHRAREVVAERRQHELEVAATGHQAREVKDELRAHRRHGPRDRIRIGEIDASPPKIRCVRAALLTGERMHFESPGEEGANEMSAEKAGRTGDQHGSGAQGLRSIWQPLSAETRKRCDTLISRHATERTPGARQAGPVTPVAAPAPRGSDGSSRCLPARRSSVRRSSPTSSILSCFLPARSSPTPTRRTGSRSPSPARSATWASPSTPSTGPTVPSFPRSATTSSSTCARSSSDWMRPCRLERSGSFTPRRRTGK